MINVERANQIDGWMAPSELIWLAQQARNAKIVVESGCWKGRSTRAMADHCAGVIYAVDPWTDPYLNESGTPNTKVRCEVYDDFRANLLDHMTAGRVIAVREPSQTAFLRLASQLGPVADFIFIDGDHRYEKVLEDIAAAHKLIRPGGLIAGHDFSHPSWPGVKRAVEEFYGGDYMRGPKSIWWVKG